MSQVKMEMPVSSGMTYGLALGTPHSNMVFLRMQEYF